jgi:hypothetical protein
MTIWRLSFLTGSSPVHYLACLGLVSLVDGLSLSFDYATPVVDGAIEEDALTEQVVAGLVTLTRDDRSPLPKEIHTTTPSWESLAESAWKTWDDPMLDRLTRTAGKATRASLRTRSGPRHQPREGHTATSRLRPICARTSWPCSTDDAPPRYMRPWRCGSPRRRRTRG